MRLWDRLIRGRLQGTRSGYSALGEDDVLQRLFSQLGVSTGQVVDVAACDGVTGSNTLTLYEQGWPGLAVEGDPDRFARLARAYRPFPDVGLVRTWVTPANVVSLLEAHGLPPDFTYLNLDIDGYDHFVLKALLERFRPVVICAEINEKIPPPVKFTVTYDPEFVWAVDHFYGQSISKLHELCEARGYALVELHYNNAFLVSAERSVFESLRPEDAYRSGYLDRSDRRQLFPANADMEAVLGLDPTQAIAFLEERFAPYAGKYEIGL